MKLADIMVTEAILPDLGATTRDAAIEALVQALAEAGAVAKKDTADITKAVLARESQATTGIGKGVALPHTKLKGIRHPLATVGLSADGIEFKALDGKPVYSVILLLSSPENPDEHLQAMEVIFKHVQRDIFRKFLRQAQTVEAVVDLIQEADELG